LNNLLKDSKRNDKRPIPWTEETNKAFEKCRNELTQAALLSHPAEQAPLFIVTDASNTAIGAALEQDEQGQRKPIAFFSKKLSPTQQKYSTYDHELLAAYEAVKYFRNSIQGRTVWIETDHKPLIYAFKQKPDKASPRQARQLDWIAQFVSEIKHVPGHQNIVADALSRIETIDAVLVSTDELATEQATDEELHTLRQEGNSLDLREINLPDAKLPLFCDVSKGTIRPYVPKTLRRRIFDAVHGLAHPNGKATSKQIRQKFTWSGINKDIVHWARTCLPCQRAKIQRHTRHLPIKILMPDERFRQVHLDIIGPLPEVRGYRYCLTTIDRYSRWPEAIPVQDIAADTIAKAFYTNWVARYGAPAVITTDQGRQFESNLFQAMVNILGAYKTRTSPYHLASNGLIERWHRTLKAAIACKDNAKQWVDLLPDILLGLRTCYKEDLKCSIAELLYGTPLRLPGEFFENDCTGVEPNTFAQELRNRMRFIRPQPTAHHGNRVTFVHQQLAQATCSSEKTPLKNPCNHRTPDHTR